MNVGFTGTQVGMTSKQIRLLTNLLIQLNPIWFHHGDCIGADEQAHEIALKLGIKIAIHPPTDPRKRAYCEGWKKMFPKKPYLDRNEDIVMTTDLLIGCPKTVNEAIRSGTWATMRFAWKQVRPVRVLEP